MAQEIDRRSYTSQLRAKTGSDGQRRLVGHAAVFNQRSELIFGFREVCLPGAFSRAIQRSDVRALVNHDESMLLGRTKSGTLKLSEDAQGLAVDILLPDTQVARDLLVSVERGDLDQMSFGFTIGQDRWYTDPDGQSVREIVSVDTLFDVSPVTFPAYPQTDISARTLAAHRQHAERSTARRRVVDCGDIARRQKLDALEREHRIYVIQTKIRELESELVQEVRGQGPR